MHWHRWTEPMTTVLRRCGSAFGTDTRRWCGCCWRLRPGLCSAGGGSGPELAVPGQGELPGGRSALGTFGGACPPFLFLLLVFFLHYWVLILLYWARIHQVPDTGSLCQWFVLHLADSVWKTVLPCSFWHPCLHLVEELIFFPCYWV